MAVISVANLKKYYSIHQKEPGLLGSLKSLFSRQYYDVKAVDNISFEINEGELVGFIGPNGAGKTTTLKVLSGLLYPTSGSVSVLGFNPWERKAPYQKQFSLVMGQKNQLWWDLPAQESFILNKEIYEIPDQKYQETLNELVELLEVDDLLKVAVRKLSLGQRMKMELIAALIHSPKILFLDEPTIGLDVVMQKKMRDFIKSYNQKHSSTIILTSHNMDDVKELCERVIIIDQGEIIFDGKLSEIVTKFAKDKIIEVLFGKEIDLKELKKFGGVEKLENGRIKILVKRDKVAKTATDILKDFPVGDLDIKEIELEDIIRQIFTTGTQGVPLRG